MRTLLRGMPPSALRRNLRLASGIVLFVYITMHLANHALGLVSLDVAEAGLRIAVAAWQSPPGTVLLYGAAAIHMALAVEAIYQRRTFRLPPAELLRIVLGVTLPIILIGHAATTRIAHDLYDLAPDYARVVANLWASDSEGRQLALLAPGWIHGCMGLHFALNRRPLYQRLRLYLFGAALLLPVLSALGFFAMLRELGASPAAAGAAFDYLGPAHAAERIALARWRDGLLAAYFAIIALAFAARYLRNLIERRRRQLVAIAYPGRTVRVPRGWSVLEASRGFHLPHAAMCGGRARCSTCRVRVVDGGDGCAPPQADERATLRRIGAGPDIRLACQLRPQQDIAVVPLVRSERPHYGELLPHHHGAERDVVILACDLAHRDAPGEHHLAHDVLYVVTRYVEAIDAAIRAAGGTVVQLSGDGIQALFAFPTGAGDALEAAHAIAEATADLDERIGHRSHLQVTVGLHAGPVAIGEVGDAERPTTLVAGDAVDGARALRQAAADHGEMFAISAPVYAASGLAPDAGEGLTMRLAWPGGAVVAHLVPQPAPPLQRPRRREHRRLRETAAAVARLILGLSMG